MSSDGLPGWYDAWKTACCDRWPNCNHCPFDENEQDDDEDYDEDEEEY